MAEAAKIYYSRKSDPKPFLEKALEAHAQVLGGAKKILLKPNLVSHEDYPTTTDPALFRELIRLLKPRAELAAGDACAADLGDPHSALTDHALAKVAEQEGLKFFDFYAEKMLEANTSLGDSLKYSALPAEYGCSISLPVLKTHIILLMTGALKNSLGLLARRERIGAHFQGIPRLNRSIVGINELARPNLFIVDFRETLINSNETRHGGKRAKGGYLFAGTDPVALDFYGFSLLREIEPKLAGKGPEIIAYLDLAWKRGLGSNKYDLIPLD